MAVGVNQLRQYFNQFDKWFDWNTLTEEQTHTIPLNDEGQPVTVRRAFERVLPVVRKHDRSAKLKLITGSENLDGAGRASRWEFFFDLPKRRAKAAVDWVLPWKESMDAFEKPQITMILRPFPVPGSLFYRMIDEGKILYRQLNGLWRQEMSRRSALPFSFRDSDEVLRDFKRQGLDITVDEVTLSAEGFPGTPLTWQAQTRHHSFRTSFQ